MMGKITSLSRGLQGDLIVSLSLPISYIESVHKLKDDEVDVEIVKYHKRRSKDANAMMWATCQDIGNAMKPPLSKEEVYRKAIRDVGKFTVVPIRNEEVEAFIRIWAKNGYGWFAEDGGESKLEGFRRVFVYHGSSVYDSKQMSILLDYLVDDAEQMNLRLRASKQDIEEAKRRWGDG